MNDRRAPQKSVAIAEPREHGPNRFFQRVLIVGDARRYRGGRVGEGAVADDNVGGGKTVLENGGADEIRVVDEEIGGRGGTLEDDAPIGSGVLVI